MIRWAILTGEYPPQPGGVSAYTRLVAEGLAAMGDEIVVYAPPQTLGAELPAPGVRVHRLPDRFSLRGLYRLDRELARHRPDRILVQYVPHAFGLKAMNLPFTTWAAARAARLAPLWVMFHEVAFPFVRRPIRYNLVALANRAMARTLVARADRVMVSVMHWEQVLRRLCRLARRADWLPVPCNVATNADPDRVVAVRARYAPDVASPLVGHFGTFGPLITDLLDLSVAGVLRGNPQAQILLIGRGSDQYLARIGKLYPELTGRMAATSELSPEELAAHLRACDLLLQPYPDGVSSRRGGAMAGLANRVPIVTNLGHISEPFWAASPGVTVVPAPDPVSLAAAAVKVLALSSESRLALGESGAELYESEFSLDRTIARVRQQSPAPVPELIRC